MKYYFLNAEDALVRLARFVIHESPVPTLPKDAIFEGDYVPHEGVSRNQFSLTYKDQPPTSPFRVVCEDFTFYDCEIVNIQPIEQTISGIIGNPQMTGDAQRENLIKMMNEVDQL